ncbi:2-dehydropantoate 2-reductase [Planococcus shenhongbingii]|uniref:2-dehydropantoate 2-reductase n=1 Tax=Planococcus shenhongbingii TaxID=3058398 RepID=A0ABT8N9A3_9BACL|nr:MULTISPECIES: 2-dehydropantoate 2-reductase [unclassified Planococcus (in: firmicutes)]MDN7244279.1 2-dehydropantoate 2-reductase [Planococcus sp. N017]WKA57448.1 2-dehydropantoate 2-reductase [Planococcus sp. N016]
MKFVIVGAGAVGMLLACLLEEAGAQVQLLTRRSEQAKKINENGIIKEQRNHHVKAFTDWSHIDPEAYLLLAVKYDALEQILPYLKEYGRENPLVFLQNGMLHLQFIKEMPQQNIAAGSVEHGALKISDNEIKHTGNGMIKLALLKGDKQKFLPLLQLNRANIEWRENADQLLFRKVLLNGIINPLTALMAIKNGELLTNPYAYELMKDVYTELYRAFPEIETLLPFEEVTALCAVTAQNSSSMLMDKMAGRQMELDTILLYLLKRSSTELPLLKAFYHLLKSTEV